ncbi:MAG: 3-oxoadipate enol-lactonase [Desulfohalobiaceae bacterium]|nr:3-oxoadipate enol-lactonase [Desulfohalobiaceae bacterium]
MPFADVNETRLHFRLDGPEEGPVVMLSNSLASDLSMWDAQIPGLIEAGYRVLRYDSRGHGQSAVPEGPYSMEMLAADAAGLMDRLGLDRVDFCGLSMGGMVAQMLGSHYPQRLRTLVLSSTSAYAGPPENWDERIILVQKQGLQAVVDATIDRWFTRAGQEEMPLEMARVRNMILNTPVQGFCACCQAIRDMDQRDSIRSISAPTLVAVGEHDPGTPVSAAEFIHGQIASSQLKIFPGAAHLVNVEKADEFTRALLDFLVNAGA